MKHLKQKYAGLSFAEAATKIGSKYPKRDLDLTAKKSYEMEMAELMRMNESAKMVSDAQDKVKELLACGGKVKMGKGGGPFAIGVPPGNTAWMSQQNGMPMMAPPLLGQPLSALSVPSRTAGNNTGLQFPQLFQPDTSALPAPIGTPKKSVYPKEFGRDWGMNNENVPIGNHKWMAQQSGMPLTDGLPMIGIDYSVPLGHPLNPSNPPSALAGQAKPGFQPMTLPDGSPEGPLPLPIGSGLRAKQSDAKLPARTSFPSQGQVLAKLKEGQTFNEPNTTPVREDKGNWLQRTFGEEGNVYTPALLGSAANIGINAAILAGGYDKVAPNNNKYEDEVRTTMQDRNIDMTAVQNRIQGAFNAGRENLKNARSANVRNAFDQNLSVGAMEQTANASLQQQQINNQYKADYANVINNLGMQDVQARNLSDELTARNKGQFQSNLSQFGANVAENSKFFTKLKANDKMNALYLDIINQTSNDFQIDPDLLGKLKQGKFSDISEGQWLQLKKSDNAAVKAFAEFYAKQKTNGKV